MSAKTSAKASAGKKGSKLDTLKSLFMGGTKKPTTPGAASKKVGGAKPSAPIKNVAGTKPGASHPPASKKAGGAAPQAEATHSKGSAKAPLAASPATTVKTGANGAKPAGKKASSGKGGSKSHASKGSAHAWNENMCREVACENLATTSTYCRMHYIKNWKKIQRKALILREHKLNQYIEELVAKYPDKYIEAIRQDLANDKDFAKVIHDLDLDESVDDFEGESDADDSLIDTIKRDFDDEGDGF